MTPHHDEVVFQQVGDLQRRLEAVAQEVPHALYARCYAKRWWSDLTDEEQDAIMAAELADDGLVYCCVTLGRVSPAEAADHLWDYRG